MNPHLKDTLGSAPPTLKALLLHHTTPNAFTILHAIPVMVACLATSVSPLDHAVEAEMTLPKLQDPLLHRLEKRRLGRLGVDMRFSSQMGPIHFQMGTAPSSHLMLAV